MTTIPCILIPLLVGLISAILGYLLGRLNSNKKENLTYNYQNEYDICMKNCSSLENKIKSLELELSNTKLNVNNNKEVTQNPEVLSRIVSEPIIETTEIPFDAELAQSVFGKKIKQDDLKIVEGIGPKIEELYHLSGIKTWKQLSETSIETSKEILHKGGDRFKLHNPSTWAKQARLCYENKWEELKKYQDELDGGKE